MSDLREKQPAHRTKDMTGKTSGNHVFEIDVDAWPYSSLRSEDVYARKTTFRVCCGAMRDAAGLAEMLAETIKDAHDIWETRITRVEMTQ